MTILNAITQIQANVLDCHKIIQRAPNVPPDQVSVYPFVVAYPQSGTAKVAPVDMITTLHNMVLELHGTRKDLPRDLQRIYQAVQSIPDSIYQGHVDGDYTAFETWQDITGQLLPMNYNGVDTLGMRYTINQLKIQIAHSTNATASDLRMTPENLALVMRDAILADHANIRQAPEYPTDEPSAFPFLVVYPVAVNAVMEYGRIVNYDYTLRVELHVSSGHGLSRSMTEIIGYADTIPMTMLIAPLFKQALHRGQVNYTLGRLQYGNIETLGYVFDLSGIRQEYVTYE